MNRFRSKSDYKFEIRNLFNNQNEIFIISSEIDYA